MKIIRSGVWLALGLLFVACGSRISAVSLIPSDSPVVESLQVPGWISPDNVARMEMKLFSVDPTHPDRRLLRDRIIRYYAEVFGQLPDGVDEDETRLDYFRHALLLHERRDFREEQLSIELSPMAHWVVQRYEPQGKEALVLAALVSLSLIHPEQQEYRERYLSLLEWSTSVRETLGDPIEQTSSMTMVYDEVVSMLPHRHVLEKFSEVLAERQRAVVTFMKTFSGDGGPAFPFLFRSIISRGAIGREFVHAWFLGDYLVESLEQMEVLGVRSGIDAELINAIEHIRDHRNPAYHYYLLAKQFGEISAMSGMRACMIAYRLESDDPRYSLCVGEFLSRMDRQMVALEFYAQAVRSTRTEEMLLQGMELMRESLYRLHLKEDRVGIPDALQTAVRAVEWVTSVSSEDPRLPVMASALMEMVATISYDDGQVLDARRYFERASALWPMSPIPATRTAEISFALGEYEEAIRILTDALTSDTPVGGGYAGYWKAMLLEQRGDCYRETGQATEAKADYREAVTTWRTATFPVEQSGAVAIRRGILSYRLEEEGMEDAFREAVRMNPERQATYAEIISFLVMEERLDKAVAYYRLAFNQDRLEQMWKIYFAIWVEGLSLRMTGKSEELARGYLERKTGKSWQERLAMFVTDRMDVMELRQSAQNRGQEVEVDYYEALLLMVAKQENAAKTLFHRVLASELVAFFEFRMAREILRRMPAGTGE